MKTMLAWYAKLVYRHRGWFILGAVVCMAMAGWYGSGVFGALSSGGMNDPAAESAVAEQQILQHFGGTRQSLYVLISSPGATIDQPQFKAAAQDLLSRVAVHPGVTSVQSYYSSGLPQLVSHDRHATYAVVGLSGHADRQAETADALMRQVTSRAVTVHYGGPAATDAETNRYVQSDLKKAEYITFPLTAALLVLIFRSLASAMLPLIIGVYGILGAFVITRLSTLVTPISTYAINIITLLGLGLAIDYSLLIVSRFRDELEQGQSVEAALVATQASAGKTVIFSAITVMGSLAGLAIFPIGFLRSLGIGGSAAVLVAALGATLFLPPLLAILGQHVGWGSWGRLLPTHLRRDRRGIWSRIVRRVNRRPVLVVIGTLALLLAAGSPVRNLAFASPDFRVLPANSQSRVVAEALLHNFPGGAANQVEIAVQSPGRITQPQLDGYTAKLGHLPHVQNVTTQAAGDFGLITLQSNARPDSAAAKQLVKAVREVAPPSGWQRRVGGTTAELMDLLAGIKADLPYAAALVLALVLLLFFLLLGSVVIPLKTLAINALSLLAVFGTLVWVFQEGHFSRLLNFTTQGAIDPTQPILIFALAFGLSMDYAIFLFSRIKEHFDTYADTPEAIAWGVQMTGGIITSAALLLIVVIGAFAAGQVVVMKEVGVGLIVSVLVDVLLVRLLLVPATMRLFGRYNWWAPPLLKRLHARIGIKEG